MKHPEYELQKQVCRYLSMQYPNVLFLSDSVAFCKLTMPQAVRNKSVQKNGFKCPDLIILEPNKRYHGLLIELKIKSPYKKDGTLLKSEHLKGQDETIDELLIRGYFAKFCVGFEHAKKTIDEYMNFIEK